MLIEFVCDPFLLINGIMFIIYHTSLCTLQQKVDELEMKLSEINERIDATNERIEETTENLRESQIGLINNFITSEFDVN